MESMTRIWKTITTGHLWKVRPSNSQKCNSARDLPLNVLYSKSTTKNNFASAKQMWLRSQSTSSTSKSRNWRTFWGKSRLNNKSGTRVLARSNLEIRQQQFRPWLRKWCLNSRRRFIIRALRRWGINFQVI